MPKKKIAEKSFNDKKSIDNEDANLKSLFKNIKEIEPESSTESDGHEEESELEEDVDDSSINLQNLEFHQFMQLQNSAETGAPVLERMALSAPRPIFVGNIRETENAGGINSNDEFKYVQGAAENTETKYFAEPRLGSTAERLDFERVGRTDSFREEAGQERFFIQSEPRIESQSQERFERAGRFEERRERPEQKYEKYRPKLPKS